jgi:hypothetical protein
MNADAKEKNASAAVAAMAAATATILALGIMSFLGEISEPVKEFFTFWNPMGSLSGHAVVAYAFGLVLFFSLFRVKRLAGQSLAAWTTVLFCSTAVASLLIFTPFVKLFVE